MSYVGIRADEANRKGYMSTKTNVMSVFPFIDDGLDIRDIEAILAEAGLGKPEYYDWRSRSGCYFCFYQRRSEWVALHDKHPDLFAKAVSYEQKEEFQDTAGSSSYTWSKGESLPQLIERRSSIKGYNKPRQAPNTLLDILDDDLDDEGFCTMCHL